MAQLEPLCLRVRRLSILVLIGMLGPFVGLASAQVVNTGTLFITQDQLVFVDDDFIQADPSNTTTNQGKLLLTGALQFVDGVIDEVGGGLTGGWGGDPAAAQPQPDFHTIFLAAATTSGAAARLDGGAVNSLIDGPVRRQGGDDFVFPTGDVENGQTHRGLLGMSGQAGTSNTDAHYFWRNGLSDFGPTMDAPLVAVSEKEYWRAWGDHAVTFTPRYETTSAIDELIQSVPGASLDDLTLAGWTGTEWVDLDGVPSPSASLQVGSVSARVDVPRAFSVITFAVRIREGSDQDGDGVPDTKEWDSNGDGQGPDDTDGDGTPDILDTDDDGDGFLTRDEDWDGSGNPCDDDSNGDGVPDYLDPNTPQKRQLWVSKSTDRYRVEPGESLLWTLEVENRSDVPVVATLVDVLPVGLAFGRKALLEQSGGEVGLPEGLKYHPQLEGKGLLLHWPKVRLAPGEAYVVTFRTEATIGLDRGTLTNHAFAVGGMGSGQFHSNLATAEVKVGDISQRDCSTVVGRVFNDLNGNGYPDTGEPGLPGARLGENSGLSIIVDEAGRFHLPCSRSAPDLGANLVLKLDERTLPTGYRVTSENPRVVRLTRGKVAKANFGAALEREVNLSLNDCAFQRTAGPLSGQLRTSVFHPLWERTLSDLIKVLDQHPSNFVVTYTVGSNVPDAVVQKRIASVKSTVDRLWKKSARRAPLKTFVHLRRQIGGEPLRCGHD